MSGYITFSQLDDIVFKVGEQHIIGGAYETARRIHNSNKPISQSINVFYENTNVPARCNINTVGETFSEPDTEPIYTFLMMSENGLGNLVVTSDNIVVLVS